MSLTNYIGYYRLDFEDYMLKNLMYKSKQNKFCNRVNKHNADKFHLNIDAFEKYRTTCGSIS